MISLQAIQKGITRGIGRTTLVIQKHSPEILLTVGLTGMVYAAILAAKATLKVEEVVTEHKKNLAVINDISDKAEKVNPEAFSKEDHDKALAFAYAETGLKFTKLYGPALGLGVLSVSAILAAHGIMAKRQVALVAAYNVLAEGFNAYRQRVVEEFGEDTDHNFKLGLRDEIHNETTTDEQGNKVKTKVTKKKVINPQFKSVYARFFDETSPCWAKEPTMNLYFLSARQKYANDLLISHGHLFLNEVYDMLGIPRTKEGSVVGWVLKDDPADMLKEGRDGYVDFDIYNLENQPGRDFVNGYNNAILLDFNVDGVIYDLI